MNTNLSIRSSQRVLQAGALDAAELLAQTWDAHAQMTIVNDAAGLRCETIKESLRALSLLALGVLLLVAQRADPAAPGAPATPRAVACVVPSSAWLELVSRAEFNAAMAKASEAAHARPASDACASSPVAIMIVAFRPQSSCPIV